MLPLNHQRLKRTQSQQNLSFISLLGKSPCYYGPQTLSLNVLLKVIDWRYEELPEIEGKRLDDGKNKLDLLPVDAIWEIGKVLTMGESKYGRGNWEKGTLWSKCYGPLLRHSLKFWAGEDLDEESKLLHTAHIATNALFLLSYQLRNMSQFDDRIKVKLNYGK